MKNIFLKIELYLFNFLKPYNISMNLIQIHMDYDKTFSFSTNCIEYSASICIKSLC